MQTQGQGHEKSPDLTGNGMTAVSHALRLCFNYSCSHDQGLKHSRILQDRAAKATDSVDRLSEETPASGLYALVRLESNLRFAYHSLKDTCCIA